MAGATAVGIGTANFRDPLVHVRVCEAIESELVRRRLSSVRELTGLANPQFAASRVAGGTSVAGKDGGH